MLLEDLLSVSDSELLSGENMLFFLCDPESDLLDLSTVLEFCLGVLAPAGNLGAVLPFDTDVAVVLDLAEARLRGGNGLAGLGASSSLDDEILTFDGLLCLGSSFFLGSSGFVGDFGGGAVVAGVSEVDDSESELLDPDPELEDELPLLLESDVEPELLSVLLLLT